MACASACVLYHRFLKLCQQGDYKLYDGTVSDCYHKYHYSAGRRHKGLQYCDINLSFFFKQYMYFGNLNFNIVLLS